MEQKSKNDLNLSARNLLSIQRIDPCAVAILDKEEGASCSRILQNRRRYSEGNDVKARLLFQSCSVSNFNQGMENVYYTSVVRLRPVFSSYEHSVLRR
ncbi:hypothetical protein KIN20_035130 [Parelaphostrongylus tenuis]|uniref:Uncharacterized protein n=1 Tax=Parelaphostrongylus tenuis TaxID=148309 RepID=A0AAD5WK70_PARTN|nr:hypothetical protein KIN20_035130 [Parelaphostrongylus tenuis]